MAGPQAPLGGLHAPLAGPQTPLAGPQTPPTGPQAPLAGPQTPPTGPQAPLAGSQAPLAGQLALRPLGWKVDRHTDAWNFYPYYRNLFPIGAAALLSSET